MASRSARKSRTRATGDPHKRHGTGKLRSFGVDKIITGLARTGVVGGSMVVVDTDVPSDSAPTSMRCRSMKRPGYPTRRNMTE